MRSTPDHDIPVRDDGPDEHAAGRAPRRPGDRPTTRSGSGSRRRGRSVHGEADLVDALLREQGGRRVLDAGCGTGRVAIELAARGYDVAGVDLDAGMLDAGPRQGARARLGPRPTSRRSVAGSPGRRAVGFDAVVMAGNVMIFVLPGTEGAVLERLQRASSRRAGSSSPGSSSAPTGSGSTSTTGSRPTAGLELVARWATWDREPFTGGDYAVSVHRNALPRRRSPSTTSVAVPIRLTVCTCVRRPVVPRSSPWVPSRSASSPPGCDPEPPPPPPPSPLVCDAPVGQLLGAG